jgi:hypothetical protein
VRAQIIRGILLFAALATGCTPPPAPVSQREVARYLQQLSEWAPQEAEVARAVRRILDTEFVDEAEVRRQMAESLPRLEAQLTAMRAYHVGAGGDLGAVHRSYVDAWAGLRQGYADITRGLDGGDQAALGRGRRALLAWREALPETADRLRVLRDSTNEQGPPT